MQVIDHLAAVSLVQPSRIDAAQRAAAALTRLHPGQATNLAASGVQGNTTSFAGGAYFYRNPTVTAVVLPQTDGSLARGFVVETWTEQQPAAPHAGRTATGACSTSRSRTNHDSYNVFVEDPLKGAQTIVSGPAPATRVAGRLARRGAQTHDQHQRATTSTPTSTPTPTTRRRGRHGGRRRQLPDHGRPDRVARRPRATGRSPCRTCST